MTSRTAVHCALERTPRHLIRATLCLFLVWIGLMSAVPALASDAEQPQVELVYTLEWSGVRLTPDGDGEASNIADSTLRFVCSPSLCTLENDLPAETLWGDVSFDPRGGAQVERSVTRPPMDVCYGNQTWAGGSSLSMIIGSEGLTGVSESASSPLFECGDGSTEYIEGGRDSFIGTLVSGDVCVFDAVGCIADEAESEPAAEPVDAAGEQDPAEGAAVADSASMLATGDPAAPSVLSSLATPANAGTAPVQLGLCALLTIVLVLLVAFPTSLLNSAVEEGSDRLTAWRIDRRNRRTPGPSTPSADPPGSLTTAPPDTKTDRPWWWAAVGVLIAGLISGFIDPEFGFNPGSARVLLSIMASFVIDVILGWSLLIWLVKRANPEATHSFTFKPLSLVIVVAAVIFTRLTGFEPGIIFGLVAGVAFGAMVGKRSPARAALTTLGYAFVVALLAWVLYGLMGGGAAAGESFWQTLVLETLAAVAIGGMAALPITLFPIKGMPGYSIWSWRRSVWALCYGIGLFAFFIVLMPMPFSWEGVSWDIISWVGMYLSYALGALAIWFAVTRPWKKRPAEATKNEPSEVSTS